MIALLLGALSYLPGFLSGLTGFLGKLSDDKLEQFRIGTNAGKDVSIAVIQAEIAKTQAQRDLNIVGMNHPIWWIGWALFVLPVGFYHAAIYFVSIFHLVYVIDRVPPVQEQWGMWIVLSMFGAQVSTGIISQITTAWIKK